MKSLLEFLKSLTNLSRKRGKEPQAEISPATEKGAGEVIPQTNSGDSFSIIHPKKQKVYIQVGLDFGTSATKVAFSQLGRGGTQALNFAHKLESFPDYCLPSVSAIDKKGSLLLGVEAARYLASKEWDSGFQRFKVIVAGKYDENFRDTITEDRFYAYRTKAGYDSSFTAERLTAIYLAYAMVKSRKMIERLSEYKDAEIDFSYNICMPIDHIENNVVRKTFEEIFDWAERIGHKWWSRGDIFDPLATSYDEEKKRSNFEKRVFAIPEAVAAMASYLLSLRKEQGLHAMIDLGAGTTDLSICNLLIPFGESKSHWYAARNMPKGTISIERLIAEYLTECRGPYCCTCLDVLDLLEKTRSGDLPSQNTDERNRQLTKDIYSEISEIRNSDIYYRTWGKAYNCLRKQTKWEKVQVLLTGGGSNLPFVEDVFSHPWWQQLKVTYPVSVLPTPDDYDPGGARAPFQRMAVAYGLARPKPQLEDYVMPSDVEDHTPVELPVLELDRDDLYPK
jgi:hypothetical protein